MKVRFFYKELQGIQRAMINDLIAALKPYGGKYEWDDTENHSIVVIECEDLVANFVVTSAEVAEDGDVLLGGRTTDGTDLILWADNVRVGDIAYITVSIPKKNAQEA